MGIASHLKTVVDDERQLLIFRIEGEIDSRILTDEVIAAYQSLTSKWTYRRIFDYRRASGLYAYEEVERLLAWWQAVSRDVAICNYVAVLTKDPLFEVRARWFDDRAAAGEIRHCETLLEATEWLDRVAPVAKPS